MRWMTAVLLATVLFLPALADVQYDVIDLGALEGGNSKALGINEHGQVVGKSARRAFLWLPKSDYGLPAGMNDLGFGSGWYEDYAGINDHGQVVCDWALWVPEQWFGLRRGTHALRTIGKGEWTEANSINNAGQFVGTAETWFQIKRIDYWRWRAVLGDRGRLVNLGTLNTKLTDGYWREWDWDEECCYSDAYGINDSGQVVGKASTDEFPAYLATKWLMPVEHAFLYTHGVMIDLDPRPADPSQYSDFQGSAAYAINDRVEVVGEASDGDHHGRRAFIWLANAAYGLPAGMNYIGPDTMASKAYSINNAGQIVGESGHRAFLWENGVMKDLNELLPPGSGWTLREARGINESGQIVGQGINPAGEWHGFLLSQRIPTLLVVIPGVWADGEMLVEGGKRLLECEEGCILEPIKEPEYGLASDEVVRHMLREKLSIVQETRLDIIVNIDMDLSLGGYANPRRLEEATSWAGRIANLTAEVFREIYPGGQRILYAHSAGVAAAHSSIDQSNHASRLRKATGTTSMTQTDGKMFDCLYFLNGRTNAQRLRTSLISGGYDWLGTTVFTTKTDWDTTRLSNLSEPDDANNCADQGAWVHLHCTEMNGMIPHHGHLPDGLAEEWIGNFAVNIAGITTKPYNNVTVKDMMLMNWFSEALDF